MHLLAAMLGGTRAVLAQREIPPTGLSRVDEQWSEPLYPPEHGHMIYFDAPFG